MTQKEKNKRYIKDITSALAESPIALTAFSRLLSENGLQEDSTLKLPLDIQI